MASKKRGEKTHEWNETTANVNECHKKTFYRSDECVKVNKSEQAWMKRYFVRKLVIKKLLDFRLWDSITFKMLVVGLGRSRISNKMYIFNILTPFLNQI